MAPKACSNLSSLHVRISTSSLDKFSTSPYPSICSSKLLRYARQKRQNFKFNKKYFSVHKFFLVGAIILGIIILVYIYYNGGDK